MIGLDRKFEIEFRCIYYYSLLLGSFSVGREKSSIILVETFPWFLDNDDVFF
jgi:hypothetical protein